MHKVRNWSVRHARLLEKLYRLFAHGLELCRPLLQRIGLQRLQKPFAAIEKLSKGFLFDCNMCGQCLLTSNGMSCPMNCPKKVRNGPCGGVRQDGTCEVKPDMRCVWVAGWNGLQKMSGKGLPQTINPVAEVHQQGSSAWLRLLENRQSKAAANTPHGFESTHTPKSVPGVSNLQRLLASGEFVVTSEVAPPDSAEPEDVYRHLPYFADQVDALNVIDSAGGHCHMSSIAVASLLARAHCEPIMQMTCRDRNRIAIQGDVLGAAALGVHNVLCLTGDDVSNGDDPGAKPVFDLDAVSLLDTLRNLRDHSQYRSGRALSSPPRLFLGAAANPFAPPFEMRPQRLAKKIAAGAQFIQTQYCFDIPLLREYMKQVVDLGLHELSHILIGVGPISSAKTARWLCNRVPGIRIPEHLIRRLDNAADQRREGKQICIELIQQIREIEGISGIHLMAPRQEQLVPDIVKQSGILQHRQSIIQCDNISELKEDLTLCLSQV